MSIPQIAQAVASGTRPGPISAVSTLIGGINDIIGKFVTDQNAKLEAQQHLLDLQAQPQEAALAAMTAQTQAADSAATMGVRTLTFCEKAISSFWRLRLEIAFWLGYEWPDQRGSIEYPPEQT